MVARIRDLYRIREAKNAATRDDRLLTDEFKQWMLLNYDQLDKDSRGNVYLEDGEHGVRVLLSPRKTTTWDLRTAPDAVILNLAREGLLSVSSGFDRRRTDAPSVLLNQAMDYRNEGEDVVLRVEEVK